MNILESVFNEQFVYALGWTLIHSLWQGALIGIIIAVAVVFLHRYSARLRYFVYSISLLVVAGITIVTFISAYTSYNASDAQKEGYLPLHAAVVNTDITETSETQIASGPMYGLLEKTAAYCRENIPLFVMIWLLGMLAFMLRFIGGYSLVRRYKSHRVKAVQGEWERRFEDLAQRIQLKKKVKLLESGLIRVPMAIGYFKPVVLLPLGMLNGVSTEQLEAILVHELAHIRRRDYLINIIQSLMEAIFFYHPVVWWLSKNIRIERENICDDIAITITGNTMEFAKALTNIQELNLSAPGLAAGLGGKRRNRLVSRIRRITGKPRIQSGYAEGFIAASILVISMVGLSAAAMITYPVDQPAEAQLLSFGGPQESLPMADYQPTMWSAVPDTNDRKNAEIEKPERESWTIPDSIELDMETREALMEAEAEMEQLEAEMESLESKIESLNALEQYPYYLEQAREAMVRAEAMNRFAESMKDEPYQMSYNSEGIVPHLYVFNDSNAFRRLDSTTWTFYMPEEFIFHDDSLSEFYIDTWTNQFVDMEEFQFQLEEQNRMMAEELAAIEELYEVRELEELEEWHEMEEFSEMEEFAEGYERIGEGLVLIGEELGEMNTSLHILKDELYADGLMEHGRIYIFVINQKQMFINGEKQSRADFKKYRRLLDSLDGVSMLEEDGELKIQFDR